MASRSSKNYLIKTTISAAFVTVAGVTSCDGPGVTAEMLEDKVLDGGTAIAMLPSGYTKQKPMTARINVDPSSTVHKFVINSVITPPAAGNAMKIIMPDGTTEHTWTGNWSDYMLHAAAGSLQTMDVENTPQGGITAPA